MSTTYLKIATLEIKLQLWKYFSNFGNKQYKHYISTRSKVMKNCKKYKYCCEICNYETDNKTNFIKHESTIKHIDKQKTLHFEFEKIDTLNKRDSYKCSICKTSYLSNSGLWKHQKKCEKLSHVQLHQPVGEKISEDEVVTELVKQNQEIKSMLLKQINENQEIKTLLIEQNNKIVEISNKPNIINNTNNNNFNLNVFLNEQCKDALNIMDFVNNLNIEFKDIEYVGTHGFVEGISKIFMNGLRQLDIYKRPIHCTDLKRETLYIKDEDTWHKDTDDKRNIKKFITKVANKNIQKISGWYKAHPETDVHDSAAYNLHLNIMKQSMGGSSLEQMERNNDKIVKNIAKHVMIDKSCKVLEPFTL